MTKIIAVSGRKSSGKSTLCQYIQAYIAKKEYDQNDCGKPPATGELPLPEVHFYPNDAGEIEWFSRPYSAKGTNCTFAEMKSDEAAYLGFDPVSNPQKAKIYNFADSVKSLCIDLLGLRYEQVWGTEKDKNSDTEYLWENLPTYVRWTNGTHEMIDKNGLGLVLHKVNEEALIKAMGHGLQSVGGKTGVMTARQVMQVVATDIMRNMFDEHVWLKSTLRAIKKDALPVALIADMRFQTEFKAVHDAGGYVIRLERAISEDSHASEKDFDGFPFREYPRTLVIPADADLSTKNKMAINWLNSQIQFEFPE